MRGSLFASAVGLLGAAALGGCAVPTYLSPSTPSPVASADVQATTSRIMQAVVQTLVADGYQVGATSDSAGLVSSTAQLMTLSSAEVDCGKIKAVLRTADVVSSQRPLIRVAFNVLTADNHLDVRTVIEGSMPGLGDRREVLSCVSRGVLEQRLLDQIKTRLQPARL